MKYKILLCLLLSTPVWAMDDLTDLIAFGSETHKISSKNQILNLDQVATSFADHNIDREFIARIGRTYLPANPSAKSVSVSIEKSTLALYFSYADMDETRLSDAKNLSILNPVGDQSPGYVSATASLKAQSVQLGAYYIAKPFNKFNYGSSIGIKYWEKQDTLQKRLTYETDDGAIVTQVGSVETITVSEKTTFKDSGISPYIGGFIRLKLKGFQVGLDVKLYAETNYSYQVTTLNAGYRF